MSPNQLPVTPVLDRWLSDYNESAWRRYVGSLAERGLLVTIDGVMVDAQTMFETRFHCDTVKCAALNRNPADESCCTHYTVEITPDEKRRIVDQAPAVIDFLSRNDPSRVGPDRDIESFFQAEHSVHLAKEQSRCSFSWRDLNGKLWCGLHSLALERGLPLAAIKPMACILFPLVVYRFENGELLLTASSRDTEKLFDGAKDSDFLPCLKQQDGDLMFRECRTAIEVGFGTDFYRQLEMAAANRTAGRPKSQPQPANVRR